MVIYLQYPFNYIRDTYNSVYGHDSFPFTSALGFYDGTTPMERRRYYRLCWLRKTAEEVRRWKMKGTGVDSVDEEIERLGLDKVKPYREIRRASKAPANSFSRDLVIVENRSLV